MRLKRLEIAGFKSFREKVVVDFSPGISGIVGPNGCGKSNIADAIRWVMGEQRVKTLRGKKMDDVIFNGSEEAAPVGMAEVSMILTADGQQFPGSYAECSEVMITRRLFRDGESEYTINKIPCRLLDVREFFMGTGVGARTYSLVEQNSVASLVEAKPEDRRQFIEEAAGISKYKSRKESAVRKMEATRENMVRLNDILREVKTQLNAISRQAKKAEQYKALKQSLKEAELTVALQTYSDLSARRNSREEAKKALEEPGDGGPDAPAGPRGRPGGAEGGGPGKRKPDLDPPGKALRHEKRHQYQGAGDRLLPAEDRRSRRETGEGPRGGRSPEAARGGDRRRDRRPAGRRGRGGGADRHAPEGGRGKGADPRRTPADGPDLPAGAGGKEGPVHRYRDRKGQTEEHGRQPRPDDRGLRKTGGAGGPGDRGKRKTVGGTRPHPGEAPFRARRRRGGPCGTRRRREEIADELERTRGELAECDERIAELREESSRKASRLASLREFEESYAWCNEGIKSLMTGGKGAGRQELLPRALPGSRRRPHPGAPGVRDGRRGGPRGETPVRRGEGSDGRRPGDRLPEERLPRPGELRSPRGPAPCLRRVRTSNISGRRSR